MSRADTAIRLSASGVVAGVAGTARWMSCTHALAVATGSALTLAANVYPMSAHGLLGGSSARCLPSRWC